MADFITLKLKGICLEMVWLILFAVVTTLALSVLFFVVMLDQYEKRSDRLVGVEQPEDIL